MIDARVSVRRTNSSIQLDLPDCRYGVLEWGFDSSRRLVDLDPSLPEVHDDDLITEEICSQKS